MAEVKEIEIPRNQEDIEIVNVTNAYYDEAEDAMRERRQLNRENMDAYYNKQDWSHKMDGQSKEFIPKVSVTVEQFTAFLKRALTMFGDWFAIEVPKEYPLSAETVRKIIRCFTDHLPEGASSSETTSIEQRIGDAVKLALLESLMIFKVHGNEFADRRFKVEEGDLKIVDFPNWKLQIDVISGSNYYIDPTGRGLYEIHEVERDLHEIVRLSQGDNPIYKTEVVNEIVASFKIDEDKKQTRHDVTEDDSTVTPRKRVVLREVWGTLLNKDGTVKKEKVFWTIANKKWLIRSPQKLPFWHGGSPFITIPLIRVPLSVLHKAVYDQVVPLNLAMNEVFNLILDGGIASVWGIKQLRMDWLEDPSQVAGGIPQGTTLTVNESAPPDAKVIEQVTEGQVPQDALATFALLDRESNSAAYTNEIKQGALPAKQVLATEVIEAQSNSAVTLDSIAVDIEKGLQRLIRKAYLTIIQNMDELDANQLRGAISTRELFFLARMTKAERFAKLATGCGFKVFGLSAMLARTRDFQRLMALLQVGAQSPMLMPAMLRKISADKVLDRLFKALNINPSDIAKDEQDLENDKVDAPLQQQLLRQQIGNVQGEAGTQSEINQEANPTSGT